MLSGTNHTALERHYIDVRTRLGMGIRVPPRFRPEPEPPSGPVGKLFELRGRDFFVLLAALRHGVTPEEAMSLSGRLNVRCARIEALRLAYNHMGLSASAIGRIFGRDHTAVLFAAGRLKRSAARHG